MAHECMWGLAGVPHPSGGVCLAEVAANFAAVMSFARMREWTSAINLLGQLLCKSAIVNSVGSSAAHVCLEIRG